MSAINDSIINNSFSSRDEDERDGNDFELRAEDMREDSRGEEFAGSVHEGEFEAVAQKRRLSPRKIAIAIGLILTAGGGAGFLAHTLQARNGSATEPDFADLKTVMQTNQPVAPVVSPAVPAEGAAPVVSVATGDQTAGVPQVVTDQAVAVSTTPSSTIAAPSIPTSPITEVSVAPGAKQAPASSVGPAPVSSPVAAAPAPVVAPAPVAAAPVKVAPVVAVPAKVAAQTEKKPAPTAIAIKKAPESQTKDSSVIREASIKPRASEQPSSSAVDAAAVINDVKPLVTVTANQIGLKSLTKDMLLVANGATTHRYSIGDLLPSGERIVFIDSHAATIVTDKQIIRVAN